MQLLGIVCAFMVLIIGFSNSGHSEMGYFDPYALGMIFVGAFGAVLLGSRPKDFFQTFTVLKEFIPGLSRYQSVTDGIENERLKVESSWLDGKKREAVEEAESSQNEETKAMVNSLVRRDNSAAVDLTFTRFGHAQIDSMSVSARNWDLIGRLAPSFGMVGTITGMIRLFKDMDKGMENLGPALSLALLTTLYGVCFGSGVATPIAQYLQKLLDRRLDILERCEKTVVKLNVLAGGR